MKRRKLLAHIAVFLTIAGAARAQDGYNQRAKKYIQQYAEMAMIEQRVSGIPASITLGQGILETEAGNSELCLNANNHFGIKSKSDWQGETYTYTDDAPNELFKKYKDAQQSFHDHSEHLHKNPRYSPLFKIPVTNYKNWAVTIRKCGYATDPKYAQRLIKIIEEFGLANYTDLALQEPAKKPETLAVAQPTTNIAEVTAVKNDAAPVKVEHAVMKMEPAMAKPAEAAKPVEEAKPVEPQAPVLQKPGSKIIIHTDGINDAGTQAEPAEKGKLNIKHETEADYFAAMPPIDTSKVTTVNGLRAFPAKKGEMLLKYAVQYKVRYPQLLEMNDLPDAPLAFDSYIYLEKKTATGIRDRHMVKDGESLLMISQEEGIQLKRLMALNHLNSKDEPVSGAILELQTPATRKPEVKVTYVPAAHHGNAIGAAANTNKSDYITLKRDKPIAPDKPPVAVATVSPPAPDKAPKENKLKNIINKVINTDSTKAIAKTSTPNTNPAATDDAVATADEPAEAGIADAGPYLVYLSGDQTDILTNTSMQWIKPENEPYKAVEPTHTINPAALAKLKAELDPIVYADDSKLIAANPAPVKTAAKTAVFYTVKKGETATAIARKHNISVSDLLKWNNISASDIKAGQDLKVSE